MKNTPNFRRNSGFFVDLVYLCSTNSVMGVTVADLRRIRRATSDSPTTQASSVARRKWTSLTDEQRADLVARYEAGETSTVLATDFGVAKSTILGVLRANSVVVRRQSLTSEQVSKATRLYEAGLSLSQVAEQLKANQETMRTSLLRVGIKLRPPTGS